MFAMQEIKFCRYWLSKNMIKVDPTNVDIIDSIDIPKDKKQLHSVLGITYKILSHPTAI